MSGALRGLEEAAVVMMADGDAQLTRPPVLVNLHTAPPTHHPPTPPGATRPRRLR